MASDIIRTEWTTYTKSTPASMRRWARRLSVYEEVPPGFQEVFPEPTPSQFPYVVLLPEERMSLFDKQNAKLLCLYEDRLDIFEAVRGKAISLSCPLNKIIFLEYGRILLKSWLKFQTESTSSTIRFNSVTEMLFKPIVESIRPIIMPEETHQFPDHQQQNLSKLEFLRKTNLKYLNMGMQSLIPGSEILGFVYQPDIHLTTVSFFNTPIFSKYLTCHLSLITDKEFIIIRESKRTKGDKEALYGAIFTFIPHQQICRLTFEDIPGKTDCDLTIVLSNNISIRTEFSTESAVNFKDFREICSNISGTLCC